MSEWRECTLGDVLTLQRGFDLPVQDRKHGPYPIIASTGMVGYHKKATVKGPGVVIGRSGSIGGGQYISGDFWPLNTTLWVKDFKNNNARYCYYLLKTIDFQQFNVGSGVPTLNRNHVHPLSVRLAPHSQQKHIVGLLGSIDDKIELNQRMNETLEAIARALFKSWFVDFDPVRAKAEGHEPEDMDAATAALFPAAFNDDGLPEGWKRGAFGSIAENAGTTVQPSQTAPDTPYIGLEHMPRRCIALSEWAGAGKVTSNKFVFLRGDFLFGKLRPYFHKVGIAAIDGISSTDILIVRPKNEEFYAFVLSVISSDEFVSYTDQTSRGTKMPRTNWKDMASYEVILPDKRVASAYNLTVKPMLEQVIANVHENRTLSGLRDTLLPKLISGELRIDDAVPVRKEAAG